MGALSFFKESVFADEYALKKGLLQSIDPRIKTDNVFPFSCFCSSDKKYLCFAGALRTMLTLDVLFQHLSQVLSKKNLDFHPAVFSFYRCAGIV